MVGIMPDPVIGVAGVPGERRLERAMISAPSRQDLGPSGPAKLSSRLSQRGPENPSLTSISPWLRPGNSGRLIKLMSGGSLGVDGRTKICCN